MTCGLRLVFGLPACSQITLFTAPTGQRGWAHTMRGKREEIFGSLCALPLVVGVIYFHHNIVAYIGAYIGEKAADWLFTIIIALTLLGVYQLILDVVDRWQNAVYVRRNAAKEKREHAEFEREEKCKQLEEEAEWTAFANWVKQNPSTAERLMCIVDDERCQRDPEWLQSDHRAYHREQREAAGGLVTILERLNTNRSVEPFYASLQPQRLFEWLKAQRDLKRFGLDAGLPPWK
jgi:hypothetical protein